MTVKNVVRGSKVVRVIESSKSLRLEREAIFSLEDAEFQMISPTRARLYHPAGIPDQVIDPMLILSSDYEGRALVFQCDEKLRSILSANCKSPNLAGCRVNARRF